MISNYVLNTKRDSLKKERENFVARIEVLQNVIHSTGITKQASWKARKGLIKNIDERTLMVRENAAAEITELREKILVLNEQLRDCTRQEDSENNKQLMNIFKEIFTQEQLIEIKEEAKRRMSGQTPFKVSFSIKDCLQISEERSTYKKLATENLNKVQEVRILLNKVIENGCNKWGNSEFLQVISPLNRLIMPIAEITKIKRKHFI